MTQNVAGLEHFQENTLVFHWRTMSYLSFTYIFIDIFVFFFQIYIHNFRLKLIFIKGELHSNYIFRYFALIGLEWDSLNLFTKMNFFPPKTHISAPFTQDIYMTSYLLT